MSTPGLPDYKKPPKHMVDAAKAERSRRKACHGNWTPCSEACGPCTPEEPCEDGFSNNWPAHPSQEPVRECLGCGRTATPDERDSIDGDFADAEYTAFWEGAQW